MPELSEYQVLILGHFHEIGRTLPGVMGEAPLTYQEVKAYFSLSPDLEQAWEAKALVEMSHEYLSEKDRGKSPFAKSPMEMEEEEAAWGRAMGIG